jgi:hypothetical protein
MNRQRRAAIATVAVTILLVGLFVGLSPGGQSSRGNDAGPGPFAWLRPTPPPAGWNTVRIDGGASLTYPPNWTRLKTDPGTATVGLLRGEDKLVGYLNATPRQGAETLANWSDFRPDHNRDEGDRDVHVIASAKDLPFRGGQGSCVIDQYTTTRATYREIACLASGPRSTAVIVAAAPSASWGTQVPTLHRAVSGFAP